MQTKLSLMLALFVMTASSMAHAGDTSVTADKIKAAVTPGEFVLTGSETKRVHEGRDAREYRVCVKTEKDAAPIKVMYDGQEAVLKPGDCKDVTGKKIDATPEHALTDSAHIVATFHHVKEKK